MDDTISRQAAKLKVARVIWKDGDSCYDFQDKCVDCLDDVPSAQPEQRWIPCSERLPEKSGLYLVSVKGANGKDCVGGCVFSRLDGCFETAWGFDVLAWMPLPKPYAERRADETDS